VIARACKLLVLAGTLASLLPACDEIDLPKSWAITYPRVLAMRSEVVGDEARATPHPGEALRLRTLIVGQEPIDRLSYALGVCAALPVSGGLPACAGDPFLTLDGVLGEDEPFTGELAVELDVPADDQLKGVERFLVVGTACTKGDARLPMGNYDIGDCQGSAEPPMTWLGTVTLARSDDQDNDNPVLADDAIRFDDEDWAPPAADSDEPPAISVAADGELHTVQMNLSASEREQVDGEPEALLLSHFVTAGKLQKRFSALEPSQPDDHVLEVEWHSPHLPPDEKPPQVLRMVFVLRDQRGGVAFTTRELAIEAK
jgi:hypothetical protein